MLKFVIASLSFLAIAGSAVKIPPELKLKRCNWSDVNLSECLKVAIEDAVPKLQHGNPTLGIPPLEPVEITEIAVEAQKNSPVGLSLKLKNIKISRVALGVALRSLQLDKKNRIMVINSTNEKVLMKGNYQSAGRFLAIPISGEGPFQMELNDVAAELRLRFKDIRRKGLMHWDLLKLDYNLVKVENVKFKFDNLIKGNKALDDSMNDSLNENWREFDSQVRPAFAKALNLYFEGIGQRFFRRVPLQEIFDGVEK